MTMRLIGLSCGPADGSSDLLLKAALRGAEDAGVEVAHVRLGDLDLSAAAGPMTAGAAGEDDAGWFWDTLMESDGLIVSTGVFNRTIPGRLKLLLDRLLGPKADVAFAREYLRKRDAGEEATVRFPFDERVLRPRVAGFLAVGGALTDHWKTLTLPLLHHLTFSMQIGVVDQVQFGGAGIPAAIALDADALERAALLGRNVAEQAGHAFDDVEFRGTPGLCPMCHLDLIAVRGGGEVECATCGARGVATADPHSDGITITFTPEGLAQSVLTEVEKHEHFLEVQETALRQFAQAEQIAAGGAELRAFDRTLRPERAAR
ncbi:MAG: flavodoxin family protein [Conexibacter sp.]|nr:flavodoxin family protein [Conexibacter sp.]